MPLSVGAGAALSLAIAMAGVGPIEWSLTWAYRIAAAVWTDGDYKAGLVFGIGLAVLLWFGLSKWLPHVRSLRRRQPSDIVLGANGIAIEGGVHDGLKLAWSELGRPRTADAPGKLRLAARNTHYDLAEGEFADERRSIEALRAAIEATSFEEVAPTHDGDRAFSCDNCGAPVTPIDGEMATCAYCNTPKAVAPDLRERIRAANTVRDARPRVERLVHKLMKQPGAKAARRRLIIAGALMALSWAATFALHYRQVHTADVVRFGTMSAIWLFPYAAITGVFLVLRASLVDRFALGLLTLGHGARRGPGGTSLCHECAAALPPAADHVVVRCVFCKTDNVVGLDLRDTAARKGHETQSLENTLRARTRARLLWGVGGLLLAVPVLAYAKDLFVEGTEKASFTTVTEPAKKGKQIWNLDQSITMPAATRDNEQMLVIVHEADAQTPWLGHMSLAPGAPRPSSLWSAPGLKHPAWVDADRYVVIATDGGEDALHLGSVKNGKLRIVHRAPALARPSFARDQNRFVIAEKQDDTWRLVLHWLDGSAEARPIADGRDPAWHPLDDVIAYVAPVDGRDRVHWLRLEEMKPYRLVKPDPFVHRHPTWSPCGGWIAFAHNEGWDAFEDGSEEGTFNLAAVTWSLKHAKRSGNQWWTLTHGSAAALHPTWDTFGIWFETDQYGEAQVFQARLGLKELWANPDCPHAK